MKGKYLTLTLNPETLQTIDAGISDQAPPPTAPGQLGPLTNLLSQVIDLTAGNCVR